MRTAAYARFSSENQRDASLDDQLRNCRTYAARQGWPAPAVFTDAAISGSRLDRPGYLELLSRLRAGHFDVLLVDDLSRLSRDAIESAKVVKELTFRGVRLVGVSDGVDTARKSHKADVGLRGLMSELYLDDLAEKTHRGLTGRALAGASAGGLPYGYRAMSAGERAIDELQAQIVRRIFREFIEGSPPRAIAHRLNQEGVPTARGGTWAHSAIHGDLKRGLGILANPIYAGRYIWNRSHWVKHPETGRRVRQERPASEWIIQERPDLAIVDAATWDAAQARLRRFGSRHKSGERPKGARGRPARYLLSGILKCGSCGGPMVVVDYYRYGCANNKDRGATVCTSTLRVPRVQLEDAVLATIRQELLSDASFQRFQRATAAALKRATPDLDATGRRLADAERVRDNIMAAIRAGIFTESTRLELIAAEKTIEVIKAEIAAQRAFQPAQFLPRARETWRAIVDRLGDYARDVAGARQALRDLLGDALTLKNENGDPFVEVAASSQINVVAGVGFEPTTFGL